MPSIRLEDYGISPTRGFLPDFVPAEVDLPQECQPHEKLARMLPKILTTPHIRTMVEELPQVDIKALDLSEPQQHIMMQIYAYLAHAYIWYGDKPAKVLPKNIARPFYDVAQMVGRPPSLSYASYSMDNWGYIPGKEGTDPVIGNIYLLQNFLGGLDEDWFILIHIDIEFKAAPILAAIPGILDGIDSDDEKQVLDGLLTIHKGWIELNKTMDRMPEACDPYCYYNRVRPYIHGWKGHPDLPEGLIYEGVEEYEGKPVQLRGETGAQSSIVPTMDALFQIKHENDPLREYLMEMREYNPPKHRAFFEDLEGMSTLRDYVEAKKATHPALKDAYNDCVSEIQAFRTRHLEYAASYINRQSPKGNNPTDVGTGGTPFMRYLKKHRDESGKHLLK